MEALGGWLRQVVAAVLLAALIDLLLPNRTMQRYVRLVAGLFILLTLASPLLSWVKGDMSAKVAAGIQWAEREPYGESGEGELAQIMAEAKRIGGTRNDQAAKLAVAELESQIKAAVEREAGVAVDDVTVDAVVMKDGTMDVDGVTVRLGGAASTESASDGRAPIAEVEPVAPVQVDIAIDAAGGSPGGDMPAAASPAEDDMPADAGQTQQISALIAGRFGIGTDRIEVKSASAAPSGGRG
ncbi:stage III sporulation protein AF [Cohnella sp. 56]|uniref:stage III sporulation protein AF n=1 Tax=Cohnella sp. 56 TaxID=3113722 RepID=UPI0030E78CB0